MRIIKVFFVLNSACLIFLFARPAQAGGPGSSTANFLGIGVGARAIGLGEAYTAVANDVYATYWNPAGLSRLSTNEVGFMHSQLVEGLTYEYGALGVPLKVGVLGANFGYFSYGSIEGFNSHGSSLGALQKSYDTFGSLSYGLPLGNRLSLGLTGKYIYKRLASQSASTLATDLGLQYKTPLEGLTLGAVIQHLGGKLTFVQQGNSLPETYKIGAAYRKGMALIALDIQKPKDQQPFLTSGLEITPAKWLALRGGWNTQDNVGPGFRVGAGFNLNQKLTLDYAFLPFGTFGDTHRISLTFRWGGKAQEQPTILQSQATPPIEN